jgi:hypothetical protein
MAVNISPVGGVAAQFFTNTGAVLTGGKIYTYAAGTTTPVATYTTSSGNTAHTNPIILDAAGRVPNGGEIWLTSGTTYKFVLKDSTDVLIGTYDNVYGLSNVVLPIDASTVTYTPAGTGAVTTTVQAKLRQYVSVKDFGAVGDGLTDDTAAIKLAIGAGNVSLYFPPGTYLVTTIYLSTLSNIALVGVPGASILKKKAGTYGVNVDGAISGLIDFVSCSYVTIDGLKIDGNKANAIPTGGTHLNGINFYLCNIIRTQRSEFVNCEFIGLNHQCCYDVWVTNNKFILCGWGGSNFSGGYFATYGAARCVMSQNVYISIWAGVVSQLGVQYMHICENSFVNSSLIFAQDVNQTTIANNTFDGPAPAGALGEAGQDAITIESDSSITISGNDISDPARHGIYVVGNFVENGPKEGILVCNDITIIGNNIGNCDSGNGLQLDPGSVFSYSYVTHTGTPTIEANWTYAKRLNVKDNNIYNSNNGIVIGVVNGAAVSNNIVRSNITNGIIVGSTKNVTLQGNQIANNSQAGAGVYDGISLSVVVNTIENLNIQSNQIYDDQTSPTQRYGVFANNVNTTNLKIKDNPLYANGSSVFTVTNSNPTTLIAPTLLNGAANLGGFAPATYFKDGDGVVHLRGTVVLGASGAGASIFVLPSGYLPSANERFSVIQNGAIGLCTVKTDGTVEATTGTNSQYFNLSGISFYGIN